MIKNATPSELIFKEKLENSNIRFLFQKGFIKGNFHCIVDFYLPAPHKLCIELDGSYHDTAEQQFKDNRKDRYLKSRGFSVLRIKNQDVAQFDVSVFLT